MIIVRSRLLWLLLYGDTTASRILLAFTASLWAAALILSADTFTRPVYAWMAIMAPQGAWAFAWGVYAILMWWRTLTDTPRRIWLSLTINAVGAALFCTSTVCIIFSRIAPIPAAAATDIAITITSLWVLMRSGLNQPPGWRND